MMNLLKAYVEEDGNYDVPSEQEMKKRHQTLNILESDCKIMNDNNHESIKPPLRPVVAPFSMLSFPRYVPGRRLYWLDQVEAFFRMAGIDSDEERFDQIVVNADPRFFAPSLERILRLPVDSQPRTWPELKDFLWRYVPHERSYTLYAEAQSHMTDDNSTKSSPTDNNIPKKSYNPKIPDSPPTKNNIPKKSYNPKTPDSTKESKLPMESQNSEVPDSPKKSNMTISSCDPETHDSPKKSKMSKENDPPMKNDTTQMNGTPKKSVTTKKSETPKKSGTPKKNNTPKTSDINN